MKNFESKSHMHVAAKNGQTVEMIPRESHTEGGYYGAERESLWERAQRIYCSIDIWAASLRASADSCTFGLFSRMGGYNIAKFLIIGIIMYLIWGEGFAISANSNTFVAEKANNERTHDKSGNKHERTTRVQSASVSNVSYNLAPAAPEELRAQQVKDYIARFASTAVAEMDRTGIPASISMAQAIIESRSGSSVLAVKNNNHFGIKCFSKSCPKGHCSNHTDDHHKDFFRIYGSATESWRAHSEFLMKYRYRELTRYGRKDFRAWARGLREFGYATDAAYDKKLVAIIERYQLHKLDDL